MLIFSTQRAATPAMVWSNHGHGMSKGLPNNGAVAPDGLLWQLEGWAQGWVLTSGGQMAQQKFCTQKILFLVSCYPPCL